MQGKYLSAAFLAFIGFGIARAAEIATTSQTQTQIRNASEALSQTTTFKALGLTAADVAKYNATMQGPRANWSEDDSPLMVLGITADSDADQTRFAELYVQEERRRNAAIFAFSRKVNAVWGARYGNEPMFTLPVSGAQQSPVPILAAGDRAIVVLDLQAECRLCVQAITNVQALGRLNGLTGVDVYFVNGSYDQIVEYGRARGIQPADVSAKRITLNVATSAILAQFSLSPAGLPAAFKRSRNTMARIALTDLAGM
jgi:integrating conjugative element protein (TIGR03759 family)